MNPNAFRTDVPRGANDPPRNVSLVDHLQERLEAAAQLAKSELSTQNDIQPAVVISGESHSSIVIDEAPDERTGVVYFVIHRGSSSSASHDSPLVKVPKEKYRYVYLKDLVDCRVFVKCKLLRIMFHNCVNCTFSLRAPVIGPAEFYRCLSSSLSIRVPVPEGETNPPIPVTTIEDCKQFNIFQSVDTLVYLVKLCLDVTGTIVDLHTGQRINKYDLGKLFWGEQERTLVCLSQSDGFAAVQAQYALNDLAHHVIVRPPGEDVLKEPDVEMQDEECASVDINDIFGTTPPIGDAWREYLLGRK